MMICCENMNFSWIRNIFMKGAIYRDFSCLHYCSFPPSSTLTLVMLWEIWGDLVIKWSSRKNRGWNSNSVSMSPLFHAKLTYMFIRFHSPWAHPSDWAATAITLPHTRATHSKTWVKTLKYLLCACSLVLFVNAMYTGLIYWANLPQNITVFFVRYTAPCY